MKKNIIFFNLVEIIKAKFIKKNILVMKETSLYEL